MTDSKYMGACDFLKRPKSNQQRVILIIANIKVLNKSEIGGCL